MRDKSGGGGNLKIKIVSDASDRQKMIGSKNKTDVKKDRITYVDKSTPVRGKVQTKVS